MSLSCLSLNRPMILLQRRPKHQLLRLLQQLLRLQQRHLLLPLLLRQR